MGWDRLWWSAVLPLPLQSQNTNVAPFFSIFTHLLHIVQYHNIRFWFRTTSYHDVTASHVNRIVNHDTGKGRRWGKCWYLFTFWNIYWQVLMVINHETLEEILKQQMSWIKGEIGLFAVHCSPAPDWEGGPVSLFPVSAPPVLPTVAALLLQQHLLLARASDQGGT